MLPWLHAEEGKHGEGLLKSRGRGEGVRSEDGSVKDGFKDVRGEKTAFGLDELEGGEVGARQTPEVGIVARREGAGRHGRGDVGAWPVGEPGAQDLREDDRADGGGSKGARLRARCRLLEEEGWSPDLKGVVLLDEVARAAAVGRCAEEAQLMCMRWGAVSRPWGVVSRPGR